MYGAALTRKPTKLQAIRHPPQRIGRFLSESLDKPGQAKTDLGGLKMKKAGVLPASYGCLREQNPGSLVAELSFTLFQEGGHAFFLVFGCEHRVEHPAFKQHALAEGEFVAAVDRFLCRHRR